jgi:hypothetical protein
MAHLSSVEEERPPFELQSERWLSKRKLRALSQQEQERNVRLAQSRERRRETSLQRLIETLQSNPHQTLFPSHFAFESDGTASIDTGSTAVFIAPLAQTSPVNPTGYIEDDASLDWSLAACEQMHEGLLAYSLRVLVESKPNANLGEREDIAQWVFRFGAIWPGRQPDPSRKHRELWFGYAPFSFDLCAILCGANPTEMRSVIAHSDKLDGVLPPEHIAHLRKEFPRVKDRTLPNAH